MHAWDLRTPDQHRLHPEEEGRLSIADVLILTGMLSGSYIRSSTHASFTQAIRSSKSSTNNYIGLFY
jgi:hypothetical protein